MGSNKLLNLSSLPKLLLKIRKERYLAQLRCSLFASNQSNMNTIKFKTTELGLTEIIVYPTCNQGAFIKIRPLLNNQVELLI